MTKGTAAPEFVDKPATLPLDVVREIRALTVPDIRERLKLAAGASNPFPPLEGLTEIPVLRRDGTLLESEGYDSETMLYYRPAEGLRVPPIPAKPDAEEVSAAVDLINDKLADFGFSGAADRANTFGLMLTAVVRPALGMGCVPLMCVDSPAQGSGKGLLVDVFAISLTGRPAPLRQTPPTRDEAEWRKTITSALLDSGPVIVLDNQETELGSAALASVITSSVWADRRLGSAATINLRNSATWIVNGNNLRFSGDITRRCCWIRLDTHSARPFERLGPAEGKTWRYPNLREHVTEHRGEIIGALLTMARAWFAAGSPPAPGLSPMGSFEKWSETVGGILHFAGVAGFLANREKSFSTIDEHGPQWNTFLEALREHYGANPWSVADLMRKLTQDGIDGALHHALPDEFTLGPKGEVLPSKRFGRALARKVDNIFGELQLQRDGTTGGVVRWSVARVSHG